MLVGIDVTHPSPGSTRNAPSIAAIVASVGKDLSQFPAQLHVQTGKQEKVDALDVLLKSRLKIWHGIHEEYPENIIVYRDGVSEGQYDMVVAEELPQLKKACRDMCGKKQPRISIVVVGKRHHTRFYVTREQDASRSKNPPNGTVVDRGVTEARAFDFFLQSHAALQGTARPAHYIVVHDEIFAGMPISAPFANSRRPLSTSLTDSAIPLAVLPRQSASVPPPITRIWSARGLAIFRMCLILTTRVVKRAASIWSRSREW